ncbi:MAG: hypothetical protein ACI4XC_07540 [Eubacterium sp.]
MDEDQLFMMELDEGLIGSSGGSGGLFKSPIGILTICSIIFLVTMVFLSDVLDVSVICSVIFIGFLTYFLINLSDNKKAVFTAILIIGILLLITAIVLSFKCNDLIQDVLYRQSLDRELAKLTGHHYEYSTYQDSSDVAIMTLIFMLYPVSLIYIIVSFVKLIINSKVTKKQKKRTVI